MKSIKHRLISGKELAELTKEAESVYQEPVWSRAVEEGLGYNSLGLLSERESTPLALVVYFETSRGPFRLIGSPLPGSFTPYQKPVWFNITDPNLQQEILQQQHAFLREKGFSSIEWWFPELNEDVQTFAAKIDASVQESQTIILAIEPSEEAMWKKMESRGRNMVRKAEKAGVMVRRCSGTDEEINTYYEMLNGTFSKSRRKPPHPLSFYRSFIRHLVSQDRLLFLSAELEGKILAMGIFIYDRNWIYYTSGTCLPDVNAYAPNNIIQWHVIQFAVQRNLQTYDLGGTGIPSIDRFKKSFGGYPHSYAKVIWRSRPMALAASLYLSLRKHLEHARYFAGRIKGSRTG